jgi:hypothetical protein
MICPIPTGPALTEARWKLSHANDTQENLIGHSSVFFGGTPERIAAAEAAGRLEQVAHEWLDFGSQAVFVEKLEGAPDRLIYMNEMEGGVSWFDVGADPADPEGCTA